MRFKGLRSSAKRVFRGSFFGGYFEGLGGFEGGFEGKSVFFLYVENENVSRCAFGCLRDGGSRERRAIDGGSDATR